MPRPDHGLYAEIVVNAPVLRRCVALGSPGPLGGLNHPRCPLKAHRIGGTHYTGGPALPPTSRLSVSCLSIDVDHAAAIRLRRMLIKSLARDHFYVVLSKNRMTVPFSGVMPCDQITIIQFFMLPAFANDIRYKRMCRLYGCACGWDLVPIGKPSVTPRRPYRTVRL